MSSDQFESTSSDTDLALASSQNLNVGHLDVLQAYKDGWTACWSHIALWIAVGVVGYLVVAVSGMTFVGLFLVLPLIMWGYIRFTLNTVDGNAEFQDLFSGFNDFGRCWVKMALFLAIFLAFAMGLGIFTSILSVFSPLGGSAISFIAMLAVSVICLPRLSCAPFLIVDKDYPPLEALKRSWALSEYRPGQLIRLFVVYYFCSFLAYLPAIWILGSLFSGFSELESSSNDPMQFIGSLLESAFVIMSTFSIAMIALTIFSIVFYGALASAYRQMTRTGGPVQSAL